MMEEYEEPIVDSDAIVEEEDAAAATDDQNEDCLLYTSWSWHDRKRPGKAWIT